MTITEGWLKAMTETVKVLSDDEVAEIAARATKASVGPWDWTYNVSGDVIALGSSSLNKDVLVCTGNDSESWGDISEQDADFIAHAREDVPALCATVRALRADVQTEHEAHKVTVENLQETLAKHDALREQLARHQETLTALRNCQNKPACGHCAALLRAATKE